MCRHSLKGSAPLLYEVESTQPASKYLRLLSVVIGILNAAQGSIAAGQLSCSGAGSYTGSYALFRLHAWMQKMKAFVL